MGDVEHAALVEAMRRNRRKLGKAVHPDALNRLHELWPLARVAVHHDTNEFGNRRTTVYIEPEEGRYVERGVVSCDSGDTYVRLYGVRAAFLRALTNATKRWHLREEGYENPTKTATDDYV